MDLQNIGIVFPGQGAQRPGMGQDFFEQDQRSKELFEEASEAIGEDLAKICFEEDERLNLTEFTQPALLCTEYVIYDFLRRENGVQGKVFAGHSLGEYSALVAAGLMPFAAAVKIVRRRGALMQKAVPEGKGSMAAVIMDDVNQPAFLEIVEKNGAEIANFNSKDQIVISGAKEPVLSTKSELEEKFTDIKVVELNVSAPFHSSLMREIESEFRDYMFSFQDGFDLSLAGKVLSNFTGTLHSPDTVLENLVKQISGSVKWTENMREMQRLSNSILEVGPNRVLSKFFATMEIDVPAVINVRAIKKVFK